MVPLALRRALLLELALVGEELIELFSLALELLGATVYPFAMSSVDERNDRLDALVKSTTAWAEKRRAELQARVDANKKILKGRTGSERLAQASVSAAQELVVQEIDDFLVT